MPKRPSRTRKTARRRNVKRRASSTVSRNTKAIKAIKRKLNRNALTKIRVEYSSERGLLDQRWNRKILIDPIALLTVHPSPPPPNMPNQTWKFIFGGALSPTALKAKTEAYITGLTLTQRFNIAPLLRSEHQSMSSDPVIIHNYVVSLRQDFGALWKGNGTQGNYDPLYFKDNVHYCIAGDPNNNHLVQDNAATFLLNKKLFKVHAEHHHTFSPFWLMQYNAAGTPLPTDNPVVDAIPQGYSNRKSDFMVTYKDRIKLNIKLSARGNVDIANVAPSEDYGPGWMGIKYQDVPATDQLFTITYCSQGNALASSGSYEIQELTHGIFNISV